MKTIVALFLIAFVFDSRCAKSFNTLSSSISTSVLISTNERSKPSFSRVVKLYNMGGKGWDNDSFLDSLGGNEEDRKRSVDEYKDFQKSRKAFEKRNEERMNSEAGRQFMKEMSKKRNNERNLKRQDVVDEEYKLIQSMMGFEQKLVVPLDDDGNKSDNNDEEIDEIDYGKVGEWE